MITSYLEGRLQSVVIDGIMSDARVLTTGVPQGSGFGPKAYRKYYRPIGLICEKHGLKYSIYADDSQIYVYFDPGSSTSESNAACKIEACIIDI